MKNWMLCLAILLSLCSTAYAQGEPTPDPVIDEIIASSEPEIIQSFPLEGFTATVIRYACVEAGGQEMAYERLDITNTSTNESHRVAEQFIVCGGLGAYGLSILRAAPNGEFLFYTDAREGSPDGLTNGWARPIWRVNPANFQVDSIGQAKFSVTGEWLAAWDQTQITVMSVDATDLTESTHFPLMPAGLQLIEVIWLPDNTGLIYIQADAPIGSTRTTVTHIHLETMAQTILLETGNQ